MRNILTIFRRELASYFATPLAYVFIVIFLVLAGVLTFFLGNFFERGQADLQSFFSLHPWLYLVLIPALSMRLWAEERKSWLMAGALLAVGACVSATTKNQVIAFVVTAALAFVFTAAGSSIVLGMLQGWAPEWLIRGVAHISFLGHFGAITRGVIDLRDVFYFGSIMIAFLAANAILVDLEKAE